MLETLKKKKKERKGTFLRKNLVLWEKESRAHGRGWNLAKSHRFLPELGSLNH